ncbi:MAG: peptidoglycan-associated lipoprotein [Gallionellales bacterium RIFCSPLOWO2_02_FULL_57_47]|nr:MAG: peptidoglycan-associated lipoprotein [Gallionellales bacterium RIFCSPLOWO2_02_FULL_57_47]OGT12677.1 MAG: peptidoglycan-associated lipoprotein [Gallionellales bacterium RIFCSPHIGHO2_02_FULL_57_16]
MKKLVISVVLVNLLAACASEKPKEPVAAPMSAAPAAAPVAEAPAAVEPAAAETAAPVAEIDELNDPDSILAKRSTHYPFDVSVIQEDDKPLVQAHAKYLSEHPERNVRLEGNCDERGSNEYNLALGQRRADGVRKMLQLGGVNASQMTTVSYGEEKPKATGHNEASWWQNRRTDIVY